MRKTLATVLMALTLASCSNETPSTKLKFANPGALVELCETMLCRPPGFTVPLVQDDGRPFEMLFQHPIPIAQERFISLFPGETIYVEAEAKDGHLVNWKAVESNTNPDKTLIFTLEQSAELRGMLLNVTNPFPQMLKYHVEMMLPNSEDLHKTSSCPVVPNGGQGYEIWPNAIFQLVFHDFRLIESDQNVSCEY